MRMCASATCVAVFCNPFCDPVSNPGTKESTIVTGANAVFENKPALVLNADFRPLSYYPLSLWSWQDAVKAVFLDRVNIVSEYESQVHSPSFKMRLPSVVSLKTYVKPALYPAFTRFNAVSYTHLTLPTKIV